ncbi:MAG: hypothetical protein AAF591_18340 [Verrucomicrobiota bacterium]
MDGKRVKLRVCVFLLPVVIPIAALWVWREEKRAMAEGRVLDEGQRADASLMGVQHPERIRILLVDEISGPRNVLLRKLCDALGYFGPWISGITYRYGILIRRDRYPDRLLVAHECVHTGQYERCGSLAAFLKLYLRECLVEGYPNGPLEREAVERSACVE